MVNNVVSFKESEIKLPAIQNVGAGNTATLTIPAGLTYHEIFLRYTDGTNVKTIAQAKADLTGIRLKVGAKLQREHSATDLIAINAFNGNVARDGHIPLYFAEKWRDQLVEAYALSMGTADVLREQNSITLEIDIAGGAVTPALEAYALVSSDGRDMGQITKYISHNVQITATGWQPKHNYSKEDTLVAIHAVSADIDDVRVIIERAPYMDEIPLDAINSRLVGEGWTPQTGYVHIKADKDSRLSRRIMFENLLTDELGRLVDKQPLINDFRVDFNMSAATSFNSIMETIGFRN